MRYFKLINGDGWDGYTERVASASFEVADELLRQEEL